MATWLTSVETGTGSVTGVATIADSAGTATASGGGAVVAQAASSELPASNRVRRRR